MQKIKKKTTYLWYCACRKLNSSLILSHESPTVNLKGCPAWGGPCKETKMHFSKYKNEK